MDYEETISHINLSDEFLEKVQHKCTLMITITMYYLSRWQRYQCRYYIHFFSFIFCISITWLRKGES